MMRPTPQHHVVQSGAVLIRLFNPRSHGAQALKFRQYGPLSRFDHHRPNPPAVDADRGILYAGQTLSCCLVEVFGDSRVIDVGDFEVAALRTLRDLTVLDLRGEFAMRAGTVAAVCKDSHRAYSQAWSQYFYENSFLYGEVDGLLFPNAHNDEVAFALYERAESGLDCTACARLDIDELRPEVQLTAAENNLVVTPY